MATPGKANSDVRTLHTIHIRNRMALLRCISDISSQETVAASCSWVPAPAAIMCLGVRSSRGRLAQMKTAAWLTVAAFVGMIHAAAAQQGPARSNGAASTPPIDYAAARLQRRLPAIRTAVPIVVDGT